MLLAIAVVNIPVVSADGAPPMSVPEGLVILEVKMTGDEFIMLQNNTNSTITNLGSYWLTAYNNVNPLAAGVANSSQQLPTAALQPGQTVLLSTNPMQTCGASLAGKLSLSLSDSGGFMQITQSALSPSGAITQTPGDVVSWSSGASGIIQSVPSNTKDPRAVYYRYLQESRYVWQQATLDPSNFCQLNVLVVGGSGSSSAVTPLTLAATSPPATILGMAFENEDDQPLAQLPTADIGLSAPQLSELLPNPVGTGNDSTDEFIELYNPNSKPFDLAGFSLLTGLTATHSYVFPAGTVLAPDSFGAFYSEETKLSLSNTASQVALLDPSGNVISSSDAFSKAKDGEAWSLAKGKWYWTTQPTPAAANIVKQPVIKRAASKSKAKKPAMRSAGVAGAKTAKFTTDTTNTSYQQNDQGSTVHVWVLALIGGGALLYGAYEYRHDIANRLFQLRSKLGARRTTWPSPKRGRSD